MSRAREDVSSKTKTSGLSLALLKGFSSELVKISTAVGATGFSDVAKKANRLPGPPKMTSLPRDPVPHMPAKDPLSFSKSNPPPPVTTG